MSSPPQYLAQSSHSQPLLIIRIPYERPLDGGLNDPLPVDWTPEKERILWHELSAARTSGHAEVDWQALSTRLACPLPYLLYKTQARYEEDLRRIHEVKPVVSTVAAPPPTSPPQVQDGARGTGPLVRRISHTDSVATSLPTHQRASSSIGQAPPLALVAPTPNSPRRISDRPVLRSSNSHSSTTHVATSSPRPPIRRLSGGGPPRTSAGSGATLTLNAALEDHDDGNAAGESSPGDGDGDDDDDSSDSLSSNGMTAQDEAERRRDERDEVGRKLRELANLRASGMLAFAAPPPTRMAGSTATLQTGRTANARGNTPVTTTADGRNHPHGGVRGLGVERASPVAGPSTSPQFVYPHGRPAPSAPSPMQASPSNQPALASSRVSRFSRDIPTIPSSESSISGERLSRQDSARRIAPTHRGEQGGGGGSGFQAGAGTESEAESSRHRSVSSQSSQTSSFSDSFSDASLSASALDMDDTMQSRRPGHASRLTSMFANARTAYGRGGHY